MAMKMTKSSTSATEKDQERYQRALREFRQGQYTAVTSDEEVSAYLESLRRDEGKSSAQLNKV